MPARNPEIGVFCLQTLLCLFNGLFGRSQKEDAQALLFGDFDKLKKQLNTRYTFQSNAV